MNFSSTEEGFVLASLKEFVKVWGSGGQANLNLECRDGSACIKLKFDLGHPGQSHVPRPQYLHQTKPRRYGHARMQKNLERAKAHHAAKSAASSATATSNSSTDDSSATNSVAVPAPDASTSPITSSTSTPSASTPAPTTKEPQSYEETAPSLSTPNILAAASADVL